ncbi:hypothetical protein T484DRAFT_1899695 [Baffinella frigidus]|nr:hypothetical protein T484DRAFT_1899695 [Cryptophyta sp. CCMP2293]
MSGTPEQVGSRAMLAAGRRSAESVTRGEKGGDLWRPAETAAAVLGVAVEQLPCPTWLRTGDMVWLSTRDAHIARRGTFTPAYMGPFAVTLVDEAHETCQLALPPHSNILDEPFCFDQLRLHCTQADEVTLCIPDRVISSGDYVQHEAFDSKARPSRLERSKSADDSEELRNAEPFSVLQTSLPRPRQDAQETAPVTNSLKERATPLSFFLDRLRRESLESKVAEVQDPDQQALSSFMALLDMQGSSSQGSSSQVSGSAPRRAESLPLQSGRDPSAE